MTRPVRFHPIATRDPRRGGYTLVEILMAVVLTLIMMAAVTTMFGEIGRSINNSRELLETTDRLRAAQSSLARDLERLTVTTVPPRRPEAAGGYLEYTEGVLGPVISPWSVVENTDYTGGAEPDTTVTDFDDMLACTVRTEGQAYAGRFGLDVAQSQAAEVVWFVRNGTLYRRQLLVSPGKNDDLRRIFPPQNTLAGTGFYRECDLSVRQEFDASGNPYLVANSLADLTKPENRYAHQAVNYFKSSGGAVHRVGFPFHPHFYVDWTPSPSNPPVFRRTVWAGNPQLFAAGQPGTLPLGMPTLCESSSWGAPAGNLPPPSPPAAPNTWAWVAGGWLPADPGLVAGSLPNATPKMTVSPGSAAGVDLWRDPNAFPELDVATGAHQNFYRPNNIAQGQRIAEDVILTNVIGFDVKVWDPGAPLVHPVDGNGNPIVDGVLLPGDADYVASLAKAYAAYVGSGNDPAVWAQYFVSFGAYVDLNYMCLLGPENNTLPVSQWVPRYRPLPGMPEPLFHHAGQYRSGLRGTAPDPDPVNNGITILNSVYDTWSFHYEHDGVQQFPDRPADLGTNGFDDDLPGVDDDGDGQVDEDDNGDGVTDDRNGVVDDITEMETSPPYPVPLRGIQVTIRVFEPDSRQVREVTVVQDFLPK